MCSYHRKHLWRVPFFSVYVVHKKPTTHTHTDIYRPREPILYTIICFTFSCLWNFCVTLKYVLCTILEIFFSGHRHTILYVKVWLVEATNIPSVLCSILFASIYKLWSQTSFVLSKNSSPSSISIPDGLINKSLWKKQFQCLGLHKRSPPFSLLSLFLNGFLVQSMGMQNLSYYYYICPLALSLMRQRAANASVTLDPLFVSPVIIIIISTCISG